MVEAAGLVDVDAEEAQLTSTPLFRNLIRQWEVTRPYGAPLNGTYADVRHGAFEEFLSPKLAALPENLREAVASRFRSLAGERREQFQRQMSLLSRLAPARLM